MSKEVENTIQVLGVKSLAKSKEFYSETLGFKVDWGGGKSDTVCQVSRDGQRIMLSEEHAVGSPSYVWIGLETDSLFDEYRNKNVTIVQEPQNRPWAYEMKVADIDGNVLWLGMAPLTES